MRQSFDTIEEILDFVTKLKKPRTGKGSEAEDAGPQAGGPINAPAPIMPGAAAGGFPSGGPAFNPTSSPSFGAPAGTGPSPDILAMVQRITTRMDWAITPVANGGGGQPGETVLAWFRGQLAAVGADVAGYTWDQIKQNALPRAPMPVLEQIAKLMNA